MLFYLECEMSLLIYGVGSKRPLLEVFLAKYVYHEYPSMVVRGYHSGLMPKTILNDIVDYIREEVDLKPKSAARKWTNTTEIIEFIKRKLL
jgi:hypothetical protein